MVQKRLINDGHSKRHVSKLRHSRILDESTVLGPNDLNAALSWTLASRTGLEDVGSKLGMVWVRIILMGCLAENATSFICMNCWLLLLHCSTVVSGCCWPQETRYLVTIRLRLRLHPTKGDPQTDFVSHGTQIAAAGRHWDEPAAF